jgi:hypothetical protein
MVPGYIAESTEAAQAKVLTMAEAGRVAVNIARLPKPREKA